MKSKALILLSSVGNLNQALKFTRDSEVLVIALDETACHLSQEAGIPFQSASDFFKLSEFELQDYADNFARQWYKVDGVDYSKFDGYSLGELVYIEVGQKVLFELELTIVLIQELAKAHHPQKWVLSTDKNKQLVEVIKYFTSGQTIIKAVNPSALQWLRSYLNFRELKLWLRREGLDYYFRTIAFWLRYWYKPTNLRSINLTQKPASVFVVDIPNSSVMGTLVPLMRLLPIEERLVIASDPRCLKALEEHGIRAIPFWAKNLGLAQPVLPYNFHKELNNRWKKLMEEVRQHGANMEFQGVDLWLVLQTYFRKMFLRRLPLAYQHLHLAIEFFKQYDPRALILAANDTYIGQIFVLAAKQQGIYSLTIQHGMVNHPKGYLPIRSTQMAVMGEAIKEWLIKFGAQPEQIVVTGQPRFDTLILPPKTPRDILFHELNLQLDKPLWLIAPDWHLDLWMRELIFKTLEKMENVQAVIRVHQNDNPLDYQMALKYHSELKERVRISRQHDIVSILKACNVLILGRSTIGLEALIAGTKIISIIPIEEIGSIVPPYLREYLAEAPFLCARTPEDLCYAWQEINNPKHDALLSDLCNRIVRRYACAIDGKNSKRVLDAISAGRVNDSQYGVETPQGILSQQ